MVWIGLYGLTIFFVLSRLTGGIYAREVVALGFALLLLLGFLWSAMPTQTLQYSISLIANILFAWYCSRRFTLDAFMHILCYTIISLLSIGILLAAAGFPSAFYVDPLDRSNLIGIPPIQGLASHKIYAGIYGAIAFSISLSIERGVRRFLLCSIAGFAVLLSGSSVGLLGLVTGSILTAYVLALKSVHMRILTSIVLTLSIVLIYVFFDLIFSDAMSALGRDASMTGRTDIWKFAFEFWSKKPFFGWAYGGIFSDDPNAPGNIVRSNKWYVAPHFHNNYLQVLAETGIIGFIVYIGIVVYLGWTALVNASVLQRSVDRAAAVVALVIVLIGVGSFIGIRYNELSSTLLFYFFFALPHASAEAIEAERRSDVVGDIFYRGAGRSKL